MIDFDGEIEVKLWSLNSERSVAHIDAKVNVCCVYFSPISRHNLVFGSAGVFFFLRSCTVEIQITAFTCTICAT
jgi:hypothetical protein